jgi:hypothetical protein
VTDIDKQARSMMGAGTRFHSVYANRMLGEKGRHIGTRKLSAQNGDAGFVGTVNLEHSLGQVEADRDN